MKKFLIYCFCMFYSGILFSQNTYFVEANAAYEQGKFQKSDSLYRLHIQADGPSATAYYNLGNAYYKQNKWALAILNYERCLQFDRRHADAKYNLELAGLRIRDRIDPIDRSLVYIFWTDLNGLLSPGAWGWWTILSAWLGLAAVLLYLYGPTLRFRKQGLLGMLLFLVTSICLLVMTISSSYMENKNQSAIIMEPSVILKSEPSESSTNLFILHAGLKLGLMESDGDWIRVTLPDGNNGWLPKSALEVI
jgi:tetratricopeptide (TPR) repeat protein